MTRHRPHFQKAYEIYKKFKDKAKTTGEDAAKADEMLKEIAKCDEAIGKKNL